MTVVEAPSSRQQERFRQQLDLLHEFLRSGLTDDDRAAIALGGRAPDYDPDKPAHVCPIPGTDRERHNHEPHPREVPSWEAIVDRMTDHQAMKYPLYLRRGIPRALIRLDWRHRTVVLKHCIAGYSFEYIARIHPAVLVLPKRHGDSKRTEVRKRQDVLRTVEATHRVALEKVAQEIWTPDGAPRYEFI